MDTALTHISHHPLTDEQLLEVLFTAEDRLTRAQVDHVLGRGEQMIWRLTELCRNERSWIREDSGFWAPVHATFILGAFDDSRVLMGLLASLRWSAKHDVDWVYRKLPSLLGKVGRPALLPLKARIFDRSAGELDRVTELEALAGVAAHHPIYQGEVLDFIRSIADNADEEEPIRAASASVLLRFLRPGDRTAILAAAIRQEWSDRPPRFDAEDIELAYARGKQDLGEYLQEGLDFYAPEAVAARQRRWEEEAEDARWADGARQGALWVEEQRHRFLTKYEFSLADDEDAARGDALWVAESMTEYLVWYEGMAPWRCTRASAFAFLMDFFSRRVAIDDPGRIQAVPENLLAFARFCAARGQVSEADLRDVERCVMTERDEFISAAIDPDRRRSARETIERLLAIGIDPRDPEAPLRAEAAPSPSGRKTSRRLRKK